MDAHLVILDAVNEAGAGAVSSGVPRSPLRHATARPPDASFHLRHRIRARG